MKNILKALIRAYSYVISPLTGPNCRFHPTCSAYAMEAIDRHGAAKGSLLAAKRLVKCHPWHRGAMLDPVPQSIDWPALMGYNRHGRECAQNHQDKKELDDA